MPSGHAAVTIASKSFLSLARVTAATFMRHNPELPCYLVLTDELDGYFDPKSEPFRLLSYREIGLPDPEQFLFQYAQQEASYAATPYALDFLLSLGYESAIFLKQETLVLDGLSPVLEKLQQHPVLLTPHFLTPPRGTRAVRTELDVLRAGVFNGGFLAFSNSPESRSFLDWWKRRTAFQCFCEVEEGLHFEQRWLDFVPSLVAGAHVLRDPGMNVGHWNVSERSIRVRDGNVTACGEPCRVFRFSGYQADRPDLVTKYNSTFRVEDTGEAAEVFRIYQQHLLDAEWERTRFWPYSFGQYRSGETIPSSARRVYHDIGSSRGRFGDPFDSSAPGCFRNWLAFEYPDRFALPHRGLA
jgi:hypothetical protein